jgi:hypothetical protein
MSEEKLSEAHKNFEKFGKYKVASDIPLAEIPDAFDLRNISGVDYAGNVRD